MPVRFAPLPVRCRARSGHQLPGAHKLVVGTHESTRATSEESAIARIVILIPIPRLNSTSGERDAIEVALTVSRLFVDRN
jgi:hypothetical protein